MYLGIETSSDVSSVAVMDDQRLIGELTVQAGLTHSEQLVPHIELLLKQSGVAKTALTGIAVSIGPGSFTGLRIGMGTAKALAYALNIPLLGVMTMDGIAHNFWQFSGVLAIMVDAQKKNVYEGRYRWVNGKLVCEQEPTVKTRDEALKALAALDEPVILAGDGIIKFGHTLADYGPNLQLASPALRIPKASGVLLAAMPRFLAEAPDEAAHVVPYYIRRSEAEVVWDAKHPELVAAGKVPNPTVVVTEAATALADEVKNHD